MVGRARRPSDEWVEEHSGGERGLVHLANAGEEMLSGFHDGCHYPACAIALQAVVAFQASAWTMAAKIIPIPMTLIAQTAVRATGMPIM